jgi:hypothetical protein
VGGRPALVRRPHYNQAPSDPARTDKRDTREGGAAFPPLPEGRGFHAAAQSLLVSGGYGRYVTIPDERDPRTYQYVRLAAQVRAQIEDGSLTAGDPAPSITTLVQEHG